MLTDIVADDREGVARASAAIGEIDAAGIQHRCQLTGRKWRDSAIGIATEDRAGGIEAPGCGEGVVEVVMPLGEARG